MTLCEIIYSSVSIIQKT